MAAQGTPAIPDGRQDAGCEGWIFRIEMRFDGDALFRCTAFLAILWRRWCASELKSHCPAL
jgi:hypothetical protein